MICLFSATGIYLEGDWTRTQLCARSWNSSFEKNIWWKVQVLLVNQSIKVSSSETHRFKLVVIFVHSQKSCLVHQNPCIKYKAISTSAIPFSYGSIMDI